MPFFIVFADLTNITGCLWKNADVSRTWDATQVIFIIFGSFFSKV